MSHGAPTDFDRVERVPSFRCGRAEACGHGHNFVARLRSPRVRVTCIRVEALFNLQGPNQVMDGKGSLVTPVRLQSSSCLQFFLSPSLTTITANHAPTYEFIPGPVQSLSPDGISKQNAQTTLGLARHLYRCGRTIKTSFLYLVTYLNTFEVVLLHSIVRVALL